MSRRALILMLAGLAVAGWGLSPGQDEPVEGPPPEQDGSGAEPTPDIEGPVPAAPEPAPESPPATDVPEPTVPEEPPPPPPPPRRPRPRKPKTLLERHDNLMRRMEALAPKGVFVIIDTGANRLYLMRDQCVLRVAVCSTGSGRFLPDPPRNRHWTFDTPKGEFKILRKVEDPVWVKPDWAFIEEGEEPPRNRQERYAPGELGDYAMDLGDGYLIHGTLYERSLGMSVTHGCVRLGAKDLDAVFHTVRIGTPVYIF